MDKHDQQASHVEGQENECTEKTGFHIHRCWGERNSACQLVLGKRRAISGTAQLEDSASILSILKSQCIFTEAAEVREATLTPPTSSFRVMPALGSGVHGGGGQCIQL